MIARSSPARRRRDSSIAPAFVDPHVHLRTPGREDEETIRSGTEAAAAGGYCAILAMPNTDPVVDSASVLGALVERARDDAVVPTGFMAAISKGQLGDELTEMAELAATGAAAFTDDGRPVVSAGLMRRALSTARSPTSGSRCTARSRRSRAAGTCTRAPSPRSSGIGPYPSTAESVMVERDLSLARAEGRPLHLMHLSARESVAALERALASGVRATGEVTPHHLVLTDEAVRSLDPNVKMNPPLRSGDGPRGAARRAPARRDLVHRAPTTRRTRGTRRTCRSRRRRSASPGSRPRSPRSTPTSWLPGDRLARDAARADVDRARRAPSASTSRASRSARARTSSRSTSTRSGRSTEDGFRSLSANSWLLGETLRGRVVTTVADGRLVFEA